MDKGKKMRRTAVLILMLAAALAMGQAQWQRYRVWTRTPWEVYRLGDSSLGLFSEDVALGATDVIVAPGQLRELWGLRLPYQFVSNLPRPDAWRNYGLDGDYTNTYLRYSEILAQYEAWRQQFPGMVTRTQIGTSWEGRPIWAYRVFNQAISEVQDPPKSVLLIGGTHAREWISPAVGMALFRNLITMFLQAETALSAKLTDTTGIYVVPVMNPDGYEYCWNTYRMWRKNRRNNGGSYGVDLNRNYGWMWGGAGSSGIPSSDIYRGPSAFSEPENQAVRDFAATLPDLQAMIDLHSYGQQIAYAWSYTTAPPPDAAWMNTLGQAYRTGILATTGVPYEVGQGSIIVYVASGASKDFFYGTYGAASYTIEMRDTGQFGFLLPESQILPTQNEMWGGLKSFLWAL